MFGDRWKQIVEQQADAAAITLPDRRVSFRELDALAAAVEAAPSEVVIAQGDAVSVASAMIAGWSRGAVVQVLEPDRAPHLPTSPIPSGAALIKQTVGASGVRRCQFFTLDQVMADVDRLHQALALAAHSAVVAPISMGHSYGLSVGVLQVLRHGVPLVWLPHPFPGPLAEVLNDRQDVLLAGVPSLWKAWCMAGVPMQAVKTGVSAGSRLTLALETRIREQTGLKVRTLYGASECGAVALDTGDGLRSSDTQIGPALPGVELAVENGRLMVRSPSVGIGYDVTDQGEVFGDQCHLTWDEAQIREGQLHVQRSVGAGINVAGRKLSPREVAEKIRLNTGLDVAIRGVLSRDPERCEEVIATVPLPSEALTPEFKAAACAQLAPWEVPRRWETPP